MKDWFDYSRIPDITRNSLDAYAEEGRPTGGFLEAVLANDLHQAVARADSQNREALPTIVLYIVNNLPRRCWGSTKKVNAWISMDQKDRPTSTL